MVEKTFGEAFIRPPYVHDQEGIKLTLEMKCQKIESVKLSEL